MGSTREKYVNTDTQLERPNFLGDNRDQRAHLTWCWLWLAECLRVAKPGAPICLFSDWRQLPLTTDALQVGGWVWRGIVPWDKTEGCRPRKGGFALQCEYIVWGSSGPLPDGRGVGCLPGFVRAFPKPSEKHHQAGKPVEVMQAILRMCRGGGCRFEPAHGADAPGACLQVCLEDVLEQPSPPVA
jgi:site-specific DNA-methyltransferase (adenine-specific)